MVNSDQRPPDKRARKGLGRVAIAILAIILIFFVGYNIYYLTNP